MTDLEKKAKRYLDLKRKSRDIDKELDDLKAELIGLMDGEEVVRAGRYTVKNTHYEALWFDGKALEAKLPEIHYEFTKVVDRTRFTVS